ncbi:MAG: hypothetical protein WBH59_05030 [Atribacterales bacterium]|nr:hypothetical protein [Atribacterota bacterium]
MVFLKQYSKTVYFYIAILLMAIFLAGCGAAPESPRQIDITWEVKGVYGDKMLCTLKMHNRTNMYFYVENITVKVCGMGGYCYAETQPSLGMILPGYYAEESGYLSYSPLFDYAETTITGRWEDGKSDSFTGVLYYP